MSDTGATEGRANGEREEVDIRVSARVLRHLSRGIYRTPAGALKELVSNSYDARARKVLINTGFPVFDKMIITDDGDGMSQSDFKGIVQRIGLSSKSAGQPLPLNGSGHRRVIGHYGIGLLAVGQLAAGLTVVSKQAGSATGFTADISFDQFDVTSPPDSVPRSAVKDEQVLEERDRADPEVLQRETFPIGRCVLTPIRFEKDDVARHFTRLELRHVRDEVHKKLSGRYRDVNPRAKKRQRYSQNFADLLALFREREPEVQHGQYPYERLCWELAVFCPLPYSRIGEFSASGRLRSVADLAERYQFSVVIDGLALHKPIEPTLFDDREHPVEKVFLWSDEQYTENPNGPKVTGYLIYKRRIRPRSLQGVLIREAGVAVGMYDAGYLEYPFNEGMKFNQLTGELFADGLSGALNIDRNSFNETDERYLALAAWFHRKLNTEVFPAIKRLQQEPGSSRRDDNIRLVRSILRSYARAAGRKNFTVNFKSLGRGSGLFHLFPKGLEINRDHRDGKGSSATVDKVLLGGSLIISGSVGIADLNRAIRQLENLKRARS